MRVVPFAFRNPKTSGGRSWKGLKGHGRQEQRESEVLRGEEDAEGASRAARRDLDRRRQRRRQRNNDNDKFGERKGWSTIDFIVISMEFAASARAHALCVRQRSRVRNAHRRTLVSPSARWPPSSHRTFFAISTHDEKRRSGRWWSSGRTMEGRKKDGDRESTGYVLLRTPRGGWRGPLGWLPHERCIRRLTGGAIKSRQQTDRQSPQCTP